MKEPFKRGPACPALDSVSRGVWGVGQASPTLVGKKLTPSSCCMLGPCLALSDPHDNKVTGCHSPHFIDKETGSERGRVLP